eukprot:1151680-Pelagomonas_calceolata.AAC.3
MHPRIQQPLSIPLAKCTLAATRLQETLEQLEWAKLDHVIDVACRSDPEAMKEQAAAAAKAS